MLKERKAMEVYGKVKMKSQHRTLNFYYLPTNYIDIEKLLKKRKLFMENFHITITVPNLWIMYLKKEGQASFNLNIRKKKRNLWTILRFF
ncbi:MAG: hypothetical protein QXU98_05660 [Candidatus Parvarchaeota archaeon]